MELFQILTNIIIVIHIASLISPTESQICSEPLDLTVVLDGSADITFTNFDNIREFVLALIDPSRLRISFNNVSMCCLKVLRL